MVRRCSFGGCVVSFWNDFCDTRDCKKSRTFDVAKQDAHRSQLIYATFCHDLSQQLNRPACHVPFSTTIRYLEKRRNGAVHSYKMLEAMVSSKIPKTNRENLIARTFSFGVDTRSRPCRLRAYFAVGLPVTQRHRIWAWKFDVISSKVENKNTYKILCNWR